MAWKGNAPVAFSPVNLSSAAAASTPLSPASAAAESKRWAMQYSRGERCGNPYVLKRTLLCNPLMPITFLASLLPFFLQRSWPATPDPLFPLSASKPGPGVSKISSGDRASFQFRQHLVRFLNILRAGIQGHCLTQRLFALAFFFELIMSHPQIVKEFCIRSAFSGAFFQQLRGPLEVSKSLDHNSQRPGHFGIVGKSLTRLQGRFIRLLVVSQPFDAERRRGLLGRRNKGETAERLSEANLRPASLFC